VLMNSPEVRRGDLLSGLIHMYAGLAALSNLGF